MSKPLVIVESPAKARTISKFLGKDYRVEASIGHIRDLPGNAKEIPAKYKKEPWARLGVNIEKDFQPLYVIPSGKKDQVKKLKDCLKDASEVFLATDEDREGESISWHLVEILKPKVPVKRLVFHEITKAAITKALENTREINKALVAAQEARRIVDRIYGYSLSPLLWKKIRPKLSAGRVQSVAIRLVVEREQERIIFKPATFWDITADFNTDNNDIFEGKLIEVDGKRLAIGKDFDPKTGQLKPDSKVLQLESKAANSLTQNLRGKKATVTTLEEKPYTNRPAAPFTTSTMQQEANRRLNFSAQRTMRVAQKLYENGFITYMRTDSTTLSEEAVHTARDLIKSEYGPEFLPSSPRVYKTKVKNAQEAHEAIRPAGSFPKPESLKAKLDEDAMKIYEMIWKRAIASQMADSRGKHTKAQMQVENTLFQATGKTIEFPGFRRAYVEGVDDPEAQLAEQERLLPKLTEGQDLKADNLTPKDHSTLPPARLTEATLVKELEARGIGRPSTYASIIQTIINREYVFKRGSALVPTYTAFTVVKLLSEFMGYLVDYQFTARMEDDLDEISVEKVSSVKYLNHFYFGNGGQLGLKAKLEEAEANADPRIICGIPLGKTDADEEIEVRVGRYGPFLSNGEKRCSIPDDIPPDELTLKKAVELLTASLEGPKTLGKDPETGKPIYLLTGRYGPYLQIGENDDEGKKPKRASLLKTMSPETLDFETALKLLELPKEVGIHPEKNEKVLALNGPYGPYIQCEKDRRSVPEDIYILDITLEQCLKLLSEPPRRGKRKSAAPKSLKELGAHPESGDKVVLKDGRYGPYVTDGTINASIPKGESADEVSLAYAVDLLKARAEKGPVKKRRRKRK
jgi:DNA topoisomerase I